MITNQAYRIVKGTGTLRIQGQTTVYYKHDLTSCVDKDSIALCENYDDATNYSFAAILVVKKEYLREIKTLAHIEFEEIQVGDKVISAIGTPGVITSMNQRRDGTIRMKWENGNESNMPYEVDGCVWLDHVEYIGRSKP